MKKLLLLIIWVGTLQGVLAQNDSLALVSADWTCRELARGVTWKKHHFAQQNLFRSNQMLNVVEYKPAGKSVRMAIAYSDSLEKTSAIAHQRNALAAINGSFFLMKGADPDVHQELKKVPDAQPVKIHRNRSIVYLRVDGSLIAPNEWPKNDYTRKRHQQGALIIRGKKISVQMAESTTTWEDQLKGDDMITSGPVLWQKGQKVAYPDDSFCNNRYPRTAVGIRPDGTVLWVTVDGRATEAEGMSMGELQNTLRWLGCTDALNLDGGGSTTMYVKGQPEEGVVNYPSDNKLFDHQGEREVANVILLLSGN